MAERGHNSTQEKGLSPVWHKAFLSALRETGIVRDACEAAGIHRTTAYASRNVDPEFGREWDEAIQEAADLLEREAVRRARLGVRKPVIYQGQLCGAWMDAEGNVVPEGTPGSRLVPLSVTEYSDTLLIFLLKGVRPEKYREAVTAGPDALGGLVRDLIGRDLSDRAARGRPPEQSGEIGGGGPPPHVADAAAPGLD